MRKGKTIADRLRLNGISGRDSDEAVHDLLDAYERLQVSVIKASQLLGRRMRLIEQTYDMETVVEASKVLADALKRT